MKAKKEVVYQCVTIGKLPGGMATRTLLEAKIAKIIKSLTKTSFVMGGPEDNELQVVFLSRAVPSRFLDENGSATLPEALAKLGLTSISSAFPLYNTAYIIALALGYSEEDVVEEEKEMQEFMQKP